MNRLALAILALCLLPQPASCLETREPRAGLGEKIIASTLKIMAKTYVLTTDFNKLKERHIETISKLEDDDAFRQAYGNLLGVIKDSPRLKKEWRLDENMNRRQAIERLRGLKRKHLCRIIDAVPAKVICDRFRSFNKKRGAQMKDMDLQKRIEFGWKSFQQRME